MAKISMMKLAIEVDSYPENVANLLKDSKYANCISSGFMGDSVEGDIDEIISYLKNTLDEQKKAKEEFVKQKKQTQLTVKENLAAAEEKLAEDTVYSVKGCRGRSIRVLTDRCIITTTTTVGAVLTGNLTDGEKTIFYHDCIGVQFKEAEANVESALSELEHLIEISKCHSSGYRYPTIKKWFLEKYEDVAAFGN